MKLLWFFCYRLRLLPYGWQRRSGETIFPRKRAYCSGPAEVVVGRGEVALKRPWSREVVISFEAGSDPPK